jgi:YgiT-type zinc finger domain-containing protein
MHCTTCEQAERRPVRRSKLIERGSVVIVVRDVPMQECPACGTRWLTPEVARTLDQLRPLLETAGEGATVTRSWDDLAPTAA